MSSTGDSSRRSITALVMKDALAVGEPPAKVKKAIPVRHVLEEEEYLGKLEHIIQRDFFPDIPKLKAQTEYLEAVERNDVAKVRELQLKFSSRRTEPRLNSPTLRRSPSTFETPDVTQGPERPDTDSQNPECPEGKSNATEAKMKHVDVDKMSLDNYLAIYNSEDNAAFEDIQKLDDRRHKIKHAWMYRAEIEHNKRKIANGPMAIEAMPADEQLALGYSKQKPTNLDNWSYKAHNAVLFKPVEVELTEEELIERAKIEPPKIHHDNTRFQGHPFSESVRKERMTKAGIIQAAKNRGNYDSQGKEEMGFMGGMGMVATPSPAPGVNESPMMTWGEIEGTPFRLDAGDTPISTVPGPNFKMPEVPLRDKLAHSMTEQIARRHRLKKEKALQETKSLGFRKTPNFGSVRSSSVERLNSMSPAARRLASNKLGIRLGTDKALKASYTPSPIRVKGAGTPLVSPSPGKTPGRTPGASPAASSLTDNLLNLKPSASRPSAADFF